MWGGWGGLAQGLSGSLEAREEGQGKRPHPRNKGPDSGMTRGAQRREYRLILVVVCLGAALLLRACSLSLEVQSELHHHEAEGLQIETPTPEPTK